ncbi:MAG: plasmid pRiA4b ORF-3 family protein [Cryobacterium sp.]|uniref:plasmid pRiA4b ORF-3 family protein n=1 Tax=Cryobacterium sp. TaxID=1926290 RepID=UPI00229284A2|nr:plasmid pRiA4b ORF-3 family protein [Cryobacterium sp.]MCY7404407.1 plasmid pRiA4b ORF-3 family protein [Cryobacterium sp.]
MTTLTRMTEHPFNSSASEPNSVIDSEPDSEPDTVIDFEAAKYRLRASGVDTQAHDAQVNDAQVNDTQVHDAQSSDARANDGQAKAADAHLVPSRMPLPLLTPPVEPVQFTLQIDIVNSTPLIWRRLSLPSNVPLDRLHDVLQAAFGWTNSHLHQFTPSADPHRHEFEGILTPFDLEEGDEGTLESELRLDQFLATVGDTLRYVYDFGDDWEHTLTLEAVEPIEPDGTAVPAVRCLDGRRKGPPEDVGGIRNYDHLIAVVTRASLPESREVLDEISALDLWNFSDEIDLDAINRGLHRAMGADQALDWLRAHGGDSSPLATLIAGVGEEAQQYLAGYLVAARVSEPVEIDEAEAEKATAVIRALLRHVGDGIRLTGAGYLPPQAVSALMAELDPQRQWYGEANREAQTQPLLALREMATALGLVRKYRGVLVPTKRGTQLRTSPLGLWHYLAARLPLERSPHGHDVALLLLMLVAADEAGTREVVRDSLDLLSATVGWSFGGRGRYGNGAAIYAASDTDNVLAWAGSGTLLQGRSYPGGLGSAGATLLARAALATGS